MAYDKQHRCRCGAEFRARIPRAKYCDPCRTAVSTLREKTRYARVGVERRRRYVDENRERIRRQARERHARRKDDPAYRRMHKTSVLRRRYGITADELDALVQAQGNRCAICDRHVTEAHSDGRALHIDHDHLLAEAGAGARSVRGLLCFGCNTTVGRVLDDPNIARRMISYLEASQARRAEWGLG